MLSIATDEAVQMLEAGWEVRYSPASDSIEWHAPDGSAGYTAQCESLDNPPEMAVAYARRRGDIVDRPRSVPRPMP